MLATVQRRRFSCPSGLDSLSPGGRPVAEDVFDADIVPARLAAYLAHETNLMVIAVAEGLVVGQVAACVHRHPDQPTDGLGWVLLAQLQHGGTVR